MSQARPKQGQQPPSGLVRVEWPIPEDMDPRYANHVIIQRVQHEFVINFFALYPPVLIGTPEEIAAKLGEIPTIRARCVGRIVIAQDRMPEFIQAFQASANLPPSFIGPASAPEGV